MSTGTKQRAPHAVAHDVFISYSTDDKSTAYAACAALESARLRCWIAPRDVPAGMSWPAAIVGAIGHSRVMVLVFSSHAVASEQVQREVVHAFQNGVAVIPLRIEDVRPTGDMAYYMSATHWLDAMTPPLEAHLRRLCQSVESLLPTLRAVAQERPTGSVSSLAGVTDDGPSSASVRNPLSPPSKRLMPHWRQWSGVTKVSALVVASLLGLVVGGYFLSRVERRPISTVGTPAPKPEEKNPTDLVLPPTPVRPTPAVATTARKQCTIIGGQWHVDGNELVQSDRDAISPALIFGEIQWTDYDFSVDVMRTDGADFFSLFFHASDQNNRLSFVAGGRGDQNVCSETVNNGAVERFQQQSYRILDHKWYTARVEVRGIHFDCFLNDGVDDIIRLVGGADRRHPQGRVGLAMSNSVYRFKNIKITDPAGEVLWKGPPDISPLSGP